MHIDGITIPRLNRGALIDMRDGGLTATVYMSSIWADLGESFRNIADVHAVIADNADVAVLVESVEDIPAAEAAGKVGIIIGWQNSDGFGQEPRNVALFRELGLRTMSLTFNAANAAGAGCYEPRDGGITALGRELVLAANQAGILLDLTHVGDQTAADVMSISSKPVCYTHAHARALQDHVRNKSDSQIKAVADTGGVVGLGALRHFHRRGLESDPSDYVYAVKHVLNVVGEDHIAMGSDITPGMPASFHAYTGSHKGLGKVMQNYTQLPAMPGFCEFSHYSGVISKLDSVLTARQLDKFLSSNWLRIFRETW